MHLFLYRAFVHHPREHCCEQCAGKITPLGSFAYSESSSPPTPHFVCHRPPQQHWKRGTNVSPTLGHLMTGPPWGYAGSPLRNALGCPILELQWQPHFWLNSSTGAGVTCANWQCVLLTLFFFLTLKRDISTSLLSRLSYPLNALFLV